MQLLLPFLFSLVLVLGQGSRHQRLFLEDECWSCLSQPMGRVFVVHHNFSAGCLTPSEFDSKPCHVYRSIACHKQPRFGCFQIEKTKFTPDFAQEFPCHSDEEYPLRDCNQTPEDINIPMPVSSRQVDPVRMLWEAYQLESRVTLELFKFHGYEVNPTAQSSGPTLRAPRRCCQC